MSIGEVAQAKTRGDPAIEAGDSILEILRSTRRSLFPPMLDNMQIRAGGEIGVLADICCKD